MPDLVFDAKNVYTEPRDQHNIYVEATIDVSECENLFEQIVDDISDDKLLEYISKETVKEHFNLIEAE
jgi:hypothetical protein